MNKESMGRVCFVAGAGDINLAYSNDDAVRVVFCIYKGIAQTSVYNIVDGGSPRIFSGDNQTSDALNYALGSLHLMVQKGRL